MRRVDLLQGARYLSTCRLLHHADKSKSAIGTNAVVQKVKARCWPDMVNKTLRRRASPPAMLRSTASNTFFAITVSPSITIACSLTGPSPTCVGDRTDKLLRLGCNSG